MKLRRLQRTSYIAVALALAITGVFQGVFVAKAHAFPTGGPLVNREIRISSSQVSATGQTYLVTFEPFSAYTVKGIIVDFCSGSDTPLINDANCTIPASPFTIGSSPSVTTTSVDATTGYTDLGGTWTATDHFSNGQTLRLTNSTGSALSTGTRYQFRINSVTNTATLGTFYARIITYTSDTGDVASYAHNNAGSTQAKDYGGIALSTAYQINISAKVQETLVFCVSGTTGIGSGCSTNVTQPNLTLGHGTNNILDNTATDTAPAYFQVSTNAQSGIKVRMKNSNTCGGLSRDGGTTCNIAARGATAGTIPAGTTAYFGMYVTPGSGMTAAAPYSTGTTNYGMDTTAGTGVTSTYGSLIASSSAPLSSIESTMTFGATATLTTPAGLYTATMTVIATGTF